ncbi:MAG: hypothetical protein RLZ56_369 [Bacteroidota bacterium]
MLNKHTALNASLFNFLNNLLNKIKLLFNLLIINYLEIYNAYKNDMVSDKLRIKWICLATVPLKICTI